VESLHEHELSGLHPIFLPLAPRTGNTRTGNTRTGIWPGREGDVDDGSVRELHDLLPGSIVNAALAALSLA
jgi:hypothetical protein